MSSTHKFEVGQIYLLNEDWLFYREGDLVEVVRTQDRYASVGNYDAIHVNDIEGGQAVLAASAPDADGWCEWYRVTDRMPVEGGDTVMLEFRNGVKIKTKKGDMYPWIDITSGICRYKVIAKASDSSKDVVVEDVYGGALMEPKGRDNKYRRKITDRQTGDYIYIDVYDVIEAYKITCSALAHAIKKLLCSGTRHAKSQEQDKKEAIWSVEESLKLDKNSR